MQITFNLPAELDAMQRVLGAFSGSGVAASVSMNTAPSTTTDPEAPTPTDAPKKRGRRSKAQIAADEAAKTVGNETPETPEITLKDVQTACKNHAKKHGAEATKALLLKHGKTEILKDIEPAFFARVVAATAESPAPAPATTPEADPFGI